jgi:hypothetical protein
MGLWLWELWTDKAAFKQAIRALAFGIAMAATTSAGAEILRGDIGEVTREQWWRFGVAVVGGMFGGGIKLGDKNRLSDDEVAVLKAQLEAWEARARARAEAHPVLEA